MAKRGEMAAAVQGRESASRISPNPMTVG